MLVNGFLFQKLGGIFLGTHSDFPVLYNNKPKGKKACHSHSAQYEIDYGTKSLPLISNFLANLQGNVTPCLRVHLLIVEIVKCEST